ncbi:MAG TPA: serine/threonine-protein kinase, partial [Candidatus Angelobacter sp.]
MEKAEQWIRVKELFNAALERDADQREPFLREACGQDESLRAEVESLLAAHFEASALSEGPFFSADFDAPAPESIGPYKLIRKLGEGGMGQVWLAEQVSPLHREVALKLLRAGIFDSGLLKRFQAERQSLAMMDHPAIAKVFDAGSTPSGQPYLVMEYVPGLPITDYCDAKKLSIGERLELFIRTCEGVQHAHQKAIIHRDLKPANILVVEVDGKPSPRIIDFGLAKAATPLLDEKTALLTQAGSFLGTPGYMSPEQTGSSGQDIDTRTDVYSLGVVLYVLLTGFLPFETKKKSMQEMLHQIREEDPPRPSARISRAKDFSAFNAAARGLEPAQLVSTLQGDLDWIVMKALEKDRNRRYGTPSELAADVGHYLRHEPVLARPAGTAYRLQKYVRRHRIGVALTAFMVLLLAGFTAVSIWQSVRATRQRDRADAETAVAKAVNQFLQDDLLSQASSDSQGGAETKPDPDVKVRTLLDRASEKVGKRFANQPLAESAVRRTIGDTYHGLGLFAEAEQHVRRSYELSRDHRGVDDLETIEILEDLSGIVSDQGRRPEALNMAKTVYEVKARKLGPEDPATAVAMQNLGVFYLFERQYAQAEPLFKKALEIQTRSFGYNNIATLNTSDSLAALYLTQSKYSEADAFFTRGL